LHRRVDRERARATWPPGRRPPHSRRARARGARRRRHASGRRRRLAAPSSTSLSARLPSRHEATVHVRRRPLQHGNLHTPEPRASVAAGHRVASLAHRRHEPRGALLAACEPRALQGAAEQRALRSPLRDRGDRRAEPGVRARGERGEARGRFPSDWLACKCSPRRPHPSCSHR